MWLQSRMGCIWRACLSGGCWNHILLLIYAGTSFLTPEEHENLRLQMFLNNETQIELTKREMGYIVKQKRTAYK